MNKLLCFVLFMGLVGCSDNHRFELMQAGSGDARTVLFDHETGDILVVDYTGDVSDRGHFGDRPATGQKQ